MHSTTNEKSNTKINTNLLCINVADKLKKDNIDVIVKDNTIITADGSFTLNSDESRISRSADGYTLSQNIGEEAVCAFIGFVHSVRSKKNIETLAADFVRSIGINPRLKGYGYMITAICMGVISPELIRPITKRLYPAVAKKFGVDDRCVERNIRNAIDKAYNDSPELLNRYFANHRKKPAVSEIIGVAVAMIRRDQNC